MYKIILLIAKCLLASQLKKSNTTNLVPLNNKTDNFTLSNLQLQQHVKYLNLNSTNNPEALDNPKEVKSSFNSTNHQERPHLTQNNTKDEVFWSLYPKDEEIPAKTIVGSPLVRTRRDSSTTYFVVYPTRLDDGDFSICSGTLVSIKWVLSAAHCLKNIKLPEKAYAGASFNVLSVPTELPEGVQEGEMTTFYPHPNYDSRDPSNDRDIALIRVEGFRLTRYVEPVKLSLEPWRPAGYSSCSLTTFGRTDEQHDKPKDYVRRTFSLTMLKPCKCLHALMKRTGKAAAERIICSEPGVSYGLCPGGSGSGLVCDGRLRAVDSFAVVYGDVQRCRIEYFNNRFSVASCGINMSSNVFQEVYASLDWLNGHLKLYKVEEKSKKSSSAKMRYNWLLLGFVSIGLLYYREFMVTLGGSC